MKFTRRHPARPAKPNSAHAGRFQGRRPLAASCTPSPPARGCVPAALPSAVPSPPSGTLCPTQAWRGTGARALAHVCVLVSDVRVHVCCLHRACYCVGVCSCVQGVQLCGCVHAVCRARSCVGVCMLLAVCEYVYMSVNVHACQHSGLCIFMPKCQHLCVSTLLLVL